MRERGLKHDLRRFHPAKAAVVPRAGTWIETVLLNFLRFISRVVPRAGTWIETGKFLHSLHLIMSFPVRERGLKPLAVSISIGDVIVVPRAGTWIETQEHLGSVLKHYCRSPCGNVD